MGVSYHSPGMFIIGGILFIAVCVSAFLMRHKPDKSRILRAANTKRLKESPLFKRKLLEIRILRLLSFAAILTALVAAVFLSARPFKKETVKNTITRRDIFLCIDLSSSNYEGVQELVEAFSDTVSGLDGDRIGISIFNTSSIQYVPMTDDYQFVLQRLDSLSEYLAAAEEFTRDFADKYDSVYDIPESEHARFDELNRILAAFDEGITAGYEIKGTSAIGEGLASCLFSFPELETEERTRIILFLTDNHEELIDDPLVTLEDAAQMCAYDNVAVFGIYPGSGQNLEDSEWEKEDMKAAVEQTMGTFYDSGGSLTAEEILADIRARETMITNTAMAVRNEDEPGLWVIFLGAGIVLLTLATVYTVFRRGFRRGSTARKLTAAALLAAMIASLVMVYLRPKYHSPSTDIVTSNLDVAFVVDTTISMWAEDHGKGTRMDGVKKDIDHIMNKLPGSSFSLIRFDNGAEILTPYTQDINLISDVIDGFHMPPYSTSTGSSLNTAYEALKAVLQSAKAKTGNRRTIVFLFSDGETTDGSSLMSFSDLKGLINDGAVMGYGTEQGGRMFYPGKGYISNSAQGTDARSVIDEDALKQVAKDLDIAYVNRTEGSSHSFEGKLESVRLMSRDATVSKENLPSDRETYHFFSAFIGLLLLVWLFLTINRGGVA